MSIAAWVVNNKVAPHAGAWIETRLCDSLKV